MVAEGRDSLERLRKLRVGVLLDGFEVDHWVAHILREVAASDIAELCLCVLNGERTRRRSAPVRLWKERKWLVFKLYYRLDERMFGRPDDALTRVDLSAELASVPRIEVEPLKPRPFEHRFDRAALAAVEAADLDVILRFGFNIIRGEILTAARFGVWSLHHGDNSEYRGGPAAFWEMAEGNPVTGSLLQVLTDELDGGRTLYRSWSATDPVSLRRGRNTLFWKSSAFVMRRLRDIYERGWAFVSSSPEFTTRVPYHKPIYRTPTNIQALRFLWRIGSGVIKRRLTHLFVREQWILLYRQASRPRVAAGGQADGMDGRLDDFTPVLPPNDRFFADPFLIEGNGHVHVVFEDYSWDTGKGVISYLTLGHERHGVALERDYHRHGVALERDYHLSFPFTFVDRGRWYMIPETSQRRTVELYGATRVPDVWQLERVLLTDITASDATLFHDGIRYWLFAAVAEPGAASSDELCVFFADRLDGEWNAHPCNPVVSDVRRARPAGCLVRWDGQLIRPAQDCSGRYGSAIVFHRIDELSTDSYREIVVGRLGAEALRGKLGTHTYNFGGGYEVIDALRHAPRFAVRPTSAR